jgi:hypothetical protein
MDLFSVTAAVIAILQLIGQVIGYLSDVKDAPKECHTLGVCADTVLSPAVGSIGR